MSSMKSLSKAALPNVKRKHRLPPTIDKSKSRQRKGERWKIPREEFIKRVLYRDKNGNRYAYSKREDPLWSTYLSTRVVDPLGSGGRLGRRTDNEDDDNIEEEIAKEDERIFKDLNKQTKSLLYVRKPASRKHGRFVMPGNTLRIMNLASKEVFEAKVLKTLVHGRDASGHTVIGNIVSKGTVVDIKEFAN